MKTLSGIAVLVWIPFAFAQSPLPIDTTLRSAESAGYWENGESSGDFRVLVFGGGHEHFSTWVIAEWIAGPVDESDPASVVHSKQLVGPGFFILGVPVMTQQDEHLRVELQGVATHEPERKVSCIFNLLADGQVKQIKACG